MKSSPNNLSLAEKRRSIRRFTAEEVSQEDLSFLMEAATLSPSAMNEQPWFFVIITSQDIIHQLEGLHEPAGTCYNAPVLLIAFARNEGIAPDTDTVFALGSVMVACVERGLGSCYIYFVQEVLNCPAYAKLSGALGVPEGYHCVGALAIGHPAEEKDVPEDRRKDVFSIIS